MENIVQDPIPEEDQITKTQLWQRNDYTRTIIEKFREEMTAELKAAQERSSEFIFHVLEASEATTKKTKEELVDQLKDFRATLANDMARSLGEVDKRINENIVFLERKFADLAKQLGNIVEARSTDKFAEISNKVEAIRQELATAKTDLNQSLSRCQVDIYRKMAETNNKSEDIMNRFRLLAKGL